MPTCLLDFTMVHTGTLSLYHILCWLWLQQSTTWSLSCGDHVPCHGGFQKSLWSSSQLPFLSPLGGLGVLLCSLQTLFGLRKAEPWLSLWLPMFLFDFNGTVPEVRAGENFEAMSSCALELNLENPPLVFPFPPSLKLAIFREELICFLFCFLPKSLSVRSRKSWAFHFLCIIPFLPRASSPTSLAKGRQGTYIHYGKHSI